jgi:hypothetical protein
VSQTERTAAVARAFEQSWSSLLASRDWWPAGPQVECARLIRESADAVGVVTSRDFVSQLGLSLRKWRAFRGARFDDWRLRKSLRAVAPMLPRWQGLSVLAIPPEAGEGLFELFDAVGEVKPTKRKWVATSKLLHHLLPDLVVPMDNQITAPFFGRSALPATFEASFLLEAYSAFVGVATSRSHGIGVARVREAAKQVPYPVSGVAREDCRIGLARVIDFAIAGFVQNHGRVALRRL